MNLTTHVRLVTTIELRGASPPSHIFTARCLIKHWVKQSVLYRELSAILLYSEIHTEHLNTLWGGGARGGTVG
jgi:hypothetical protein